LDTAFLVIIRQRTSRIKAAGGCEKAQIRLKNGRRDIATRKRTPPAGGGGGVQVFADTHRSAAVPPDVNQTAWPKRL